MGYHRAGFEVVGVDNQPQKHYPFEFYLADALEFCAERGHEFDAIHASPPCQKYTGLRKITLSRFKKAPDHPDLILQTRTALQSTERWYVIENVQNSPLHTQFVLCGASLGLDHLARHRHFESNVMFWNIPPCSHRRNTYTVGVYGERPDGRRVSYKQHRLVRVVRSLDEARLEMGIDWMDWNEIRNAIPPVYTEFIGRQLYSYLEGRAAYSRNYP